MAIQSFADGPTREFFRTGRVAQRAGWSDIRHVARRKLDMVDYAEALTDLQSPPGNRLEALKGPLRGLYSIRINDRWRIVFRWTEAGPAEVRIADYH